jgi:hypothetical protein
MPYCVVSVANEVSRLGAITYDECAHRIIKGMNLKLEDHPLSALCDCLFDIFAATLHIYRPSLPSAT